MTLPRSSAACNSVKRDRVSCSNGKPAEMSTMVFGASMRRRAVAALDMLVSTDCT